MSPLNRQHPRSQPIACRRGRVVVWLVMIDILAPHAFGYRSRQPERNVEEAVIATSDVTFRPHDSKQSNDNRLEPVGPSPAVPQPSLPGGKTEAPLTAFIKYRLAQSLLERAKPSEAMQAAREAIRLKPDFVDAHFLLGVILARQGSNSYGAAIDQFLQVLRLDSKHVDARVNLSNLLEQEGEFEAAAEMLKEALSLTADERADLQVMLGRKQQLAEKYQEAIQSFRRALALDPLVPDAHYGLAMTLRSLGDLEGARAEFELTLKVNANDVYAHYQLGRLLMLQKESSEAAYHLEEAVRLKPDLAEAYAKLGLLYRSLKRDDEAERAFRSAVRLNPKLEKACYGLAQLLQAKGQKEEARKFFDQVEQAKTTSSLTYQASTLNIRGIELMKTGHLDEALKDFRDALALDSSMASAAYNQGLVLAQMGKTQESIESFRTAIRLRPGFVLAHYGLGLALQLAGDPAAEEQLRKAQFMKRLAPQGALVNRANKPDDSD